MDRHSEYLTGERVVVSQGEWAGSVGIVSWVVTGEAAGYVLVQSRGNIAGLRVLAEDIRPAEPNTPGFTQLAYHLNRLVSFLIEKTFL